MSRRLLVLAFDGLDWALLQQLAADGQLPVFARLMAEGSSAALALPAPHGAAVHWASVATGLAADRHGICGALMCRADGLLLAPPSAADLQGAPFWQRVWAAGGVARVAGWPATLATPGDLPRGSCVVADGFQQPEHAVHQGWPLAPQAVMPAAERPTVREARLHPDHVGADTLTALLGDLPSAAQAALAPAARQLLARWASVHNLGVHWAGQTDGWALLALRFDGWPAWAAALAAQGLAQPAVLAPWCRYLDLMLGRYLSLLGGDGHLLLLTQTDAPPPSFDTEVGAETLTGLASSSPTYRLAGLGGLLLAGPGVAAGALALPVSGLAVHGQVLALLGLSADQLPPVLMPVLMPAAAWQDDDATTADWLRAHAVPAADLRAMRARARAQQAANLIGWAAARAAQGDCEDAADALRQALGLLPGDKVLRLLLAQARVEAGLAPPGSAPDDDSLTADLLAGLAAFAARDWAAAAVPLARLVAAAAPRPLAALAAGWLGRAELALGDAAAAEPHLAAALHEEAANAPLWLAWHQASLALGRPAEAARGLALARALLPGLGTLAYRHP